MFNKDTLPGSGIEELVTAYPLPLVEAIYPNDCHVCELEIDPLSDETQACNGAVVDDIVAVITP